MTYAEKLKDPRWQIKRSQTINYYGNKCEYCGSTENIHVHHRKYISGLEPWDYDIEDLQLLCADCHEQEHLRWNAMENDKYRTSKGNTPDSSWHIPVTWLTYNPDAVK